MHQLRIEGHIVSGKSIGKTPCRYIYASCSSCGRMRYVRLSRKENLCLFCGLQKFFPLSKHSEETKRKISEIMKNKQKGKNNSMYGRTAELNPGWKGGKRTYYHKVSHRVWENFWNQKVPEGYLIHHIDENPANNEITNLTNMMINFHSSKHNKGRISSYHIKLGKYLKKGLSLKEAHGCMRCR